MSDKIMQNKNRFMEIYKTHITREGADRLLTYLEKSDFFTAPSSTRFHCSYEGGLCEHSLNVYDCLKDYLTRDFVKNRYNLNPSEEKIAIVALLHDLCKVNTYTVSMRNKKNESGQWVQVPFYEFKEKFNYGSHGGKSIFIIQEFMKLDPDEQVAINCHMGAYDRMPGDFSLNNAYAQFPLALALHIADVESSVILEHE
ncbi:hydrolase [Proteocatella sphenisci]|uniref:hydrolase n=1 Tax=Proteocatella sphenisci TaxID=181070 RepID=UPI0004B214DA|nr:hydrolase [Proteocatella sphenisci]